MSHSYYPLFTAKQVSLIKRRCRKLKVKPELVDDCLQQLALKALQLNNAKIVLIPNAIDNHIKSLLTKEIRYEKRLALLKEGFQEAIIYPLSLQVDIQTLMTLMTHRQRQVCELLVTGLTHKQISKELKISPRTIGREIVMMKRLFFKCYF